MKKLLLILIFSSIDAIEMENHSIVIPNHLSILKKNVGKSTSTTKKPVTFDKFPIKITWSWSGKRIRRFDEKKCIESTCILYESIAEGFDRPIYQENKILIIPSEYWITDGELIQSRKEAWGEQFRTENQIPTDDQCEELYKQKEERIEKYRKETLARIKSAHAEEEDYLSEDDDSFYIATRCTGIAAVAVAATYFYYKYKQAE